MRSSQAFFESGSSRGRGGGGGLFEMVRRVPDSWGGWGIKITIADTYKEGQYTERESKTVKSSTPLECKKLCTFRTKELVWMGGDVVGFPGVGAKMRKRDQRTRRKGAMQTTFSGSLEKRNARANDGRDCRECEGGG
jgi:hypothetical protein